METPKEYYYTYYSYEEYGRGYIGSRKCYCPPDKDVKYFGSFKDKSFKPTQKIILKTYATREEALADEIILHNYYNVANNSHFANKAKLTSTKFCLSSEKLIEIGKNLGNKSKENRSGIHAFTTEQRREVGKKGLETQKKLGTGLYGLTLEQRRENSKKYALLGIETQRKLGTGLYGIKTEQRRENGKISAQTNKKNNTGLYGFTTEDRREYVKITNSQKWECCITGYVSTAAGVVSYQKGKGIDTSKTNRRRLA